MARKATVFESRLDILRAEYAKDYDIESITSANDRSNLDLLLTTQLIIQDLQKRIQALIETNIADPDEFKKISDVLRDQITQSIKLETALAIDRKTRKKENSVDDPATYIAELKKSAVEFLDKRLLKVYCPDCKVLLGRISAVHEHTKYHCMFQCSQCQKLATITREEKDVFYDLKANDKEWRRKHPIQIIQPKKSNVPTLELEDIEDEEIIGSDVDEGLADGT